MNVGFVFDTVLLKKGNDYYGMTLTYDFFKERYLNKMKSLLLITRVEDYEKYSGNASGYKITNGENINVSPVISYKTIPDAFLKKSKIVKEMKKSILQCDKMIIRMPSVLGIIACSICRKNNIPYLIEMVACAWDGYMNHTNRIGKIIAPFMFLSTRKCIKKSNYVLYVTTSFLQNRYPSFGKQFSCSDVIIPKENIDILNNKLRQMSSINIKNLSMCTVANVGMRYKGHIYAFKAIKQLKKYNVDIKYYLAGNGNQTFLKDKAKRLGIEDNIIFLGSLEHDEVFKLLDKIDIYIQPSLQEGLPRALVEAMSRACFCIGSTAGGIPELISNKYIFKKRNVTQLVDIILNLNKQDIIKECSNNYAKALSFSRTELDKKRNDIYLEFLEG